MAWPIVLLIGLVYAADSSGENCTDRVPAAVLLTHQLGAVARPTGGESIKAFALLQRSLYVFNDLNETSTAVLTEASQDVEDTATDSHEICVPPCVGGCELLKDQTFHKQLHDGTSAAAEKGLLMAGLMRNDGYKSNKLFDALRNVGKYFARKHLVVIENDSTDDTRAVLKERCQGSDSWCFELTLPEMGEKQDVGVNSRIMHMTSLRKILLQEVRRYVQSSSESWDFLLMFDGDIFSESNGGFDPAATLALMGYQSLAEYPPDVVCSNGIMDWSMGGPGRFRDTFALRQNSFDEAELEAGKPGGDLYFKGNEMVQVKSCFSGLALYSLKSLLSSGCEYSYQDEDTCEHVTLHRCMADKGYGNVSIYPPWTVLYTQAPPTACAKLDTQEITRGC